ncbi:MAG: SPFH domain-containing protein [Deltaproteobacteria bacterium]|nr:SPFH domain-containing protein [Deltaproteobacteria bacterium]
MSTAKATVIAHPAAVREVTGWRRGRPIEDPEKMKRWGWVTARPSEFLVHCRRGRVLEDSSGQGATCFKWPMDSVAVVPTSLQRVQFTADQVTREKVGVAVTGLAVYRIANPLLAFRLLNFSFPERAQEKLDEVLVEMLIGACRRLIANLEVEACLTQRKSALAERLLQEIAPVVGGSGRARDASDQGWGVVVDTIEIQEVRVLSDSVFEAMQAPYRSRIDREAREARAEAAQLATLREAEAQQRMQEARLEGEAAVRTRQAELAREAAERKMQDAIREKERLVQEAAAEVAAHETRMQAAAVRAELETSEARGRHLLRQEEARLLRFERLLHAEGELKLAEIRRLDAESDARRTLAENLPELAQAVGARFGEVKITQIGGGESPFASIAQAVASLLELAREG